MKTRWRAAVGVAFALASCAKAEPTLEEQAQRSDAQKTACRELPDGDYEPAEGTEGLTVEAFDCGFAYPSAITISADGRWAFVAELKGVVYVYAKGDDRFELQGTPFHDLGDLGVEDEAGLTGVALAPRFDVDSEANEDHDVFLSFQFRGEGGTTRNRVQRVSAELRDGELRARDPRNIFTSEIAAVQAHQIHGGVTLELLGQTHVLVPIGHSHGHYDDHDEGHGAGTLWMMTREGEPPLGPHPWPEWPYVRAVGLRNAYGLELLPEELDPKRGVAGFENGDHDSDRAWLVHPVDWSGDEAYKIDLGYAGDDVSEGWKSFPDPAVTDDEGKPRNAVFHLFKPVVSPTAVSVHPGGGMIPRSDEDGVSFVCAAFGQSGTVDLSPGKDVQLVRVQNVAAGELRSTAKILVQRKASTIGDFVHPVGLDVDPTDGSIYFADIITGILYRVRVE